MRTARSEHSARRRAADRWAVDPAAGRARWRGSPPSGTPRRPAVAAACSALAALACPLELPPHLAVHLPRELVRLLAGGVQIGAALRRGQAAHSGLRPLRILRRARPLELLDRARELGILALERRLRRFL